MPSKSQVQYTGDDWALDKPEKTPFEAIDEGMYNAVCVEVVPPTIRPDFHKNPAAFTRFVFATEEVNSQGKQFIASTRWLPVKTHPKSNMGKLMRLWLGSDFPTDEALENGSFKMKASLEGRQAKLTIEHDKDDDGNTWVRIARVKENPAGDVKPDGSYVRTTDREDAEPVVDVNAALAEEEDAPF